MVNRESIHSIHGDIFSKTANLLSSKSLGFKIYVSRRYVSNQKRRIENEVEVEDFLRKKGFIVIFPEQMTLMDQINLFNAAGLIVGPAGSAFHTILFLRNKPRIEIFTNFINLNYVLIDSLKNCNVRYSNLFSKRIDGSVCIDLNLLSKIIQ
jgi:capsular polysaccharide biosynthesis protein